jgi:putative transposase
MKAYRFRLYPNKTTTDNLNHTFDLCRFTYNQLLEQLNKQEKVDRNAIQHHIVELKKQYPELEEVYSKTLQYECYRLFSNLRALSQLKKKGVRHGKLRFKGRDWFKTIQYNQSGYKITKTNKRLDKLHLAKIGDIPIRVHRNYSGNIKQITIKKTIEKWYAIVITDEPYQMKHGNKELGFDVGVINFLTDSDGNKTDNPLFYNKSLDRIKKAHQELSRKKRGSKNRLKAKQNLAKLYEKIDNQKKDFFHKVTTNIVKDCSLIGIENLDIKQMTNKKLNGNKYQNMRNILDSSWGLFFGMLKHKAESAGAKLVKVKPENTTKTCSFCGYRQDMPLYKRTYECPSCGQSIDRDYNSAINILRLAKGLGFVECDYVAQ